MLMTIGCAFVFSSSFFPIKLKLLAPKIKIINASNQYAYDIMRGTSDEFKRRTLKTEVKQKVA